MKTMNILIPNATSPKNTGNQAILSVVITLLYQAFPKCDIVLHGFDPHLQKDKVKIVRHSLYSWVVFFDTRFFSRIRRMMMLALGLIGFPWIPRELSDILKDYKNADLIVLDPGGYLTTHSGITQTLNFFMQLLPIWYGLQLKKTIIQSPCTFGTFAYSWQESIASYLFRRIHRVFTREDISFGALQAKGALVERSCDVIFFIRRKTNRSHLLRMNKTLGIVLRQWFNSSVQQEREQRIIDAIVRFCENYGYSVVPIVHCDGIEYGDIDRLATERVVHALGGYGIHTHPMHIVNDYTDARQWYGKVSLLFSMRLHAGLLALMEGTPAIVMSNEIKTKGIFHMLGIPEMAISLDSEDIYEKLAHSIAHKQSIQRKIDRKIKELQLFRQTFIYSVRNLVDESIKKEIKK